jgi:hypothetical protein
MEFFLLIEVEVSGSRSPGLKNFFYTFAHITFIFLTNIFHLWKEDNLHGILPLDEVGVSCVNVTSAKNRFYTIARTFFIYKQIYFVFDK